MPKTIETLDSFPADVIFGSFSFRVLLSVGDDLGLTPGECAELTVSFFTKEGIFLHPANSDMRERVMDAIREGLKA